MITIAVFPWFDVVSKGIMEGEQTRCVNIPAALTTRTEDTARMATASEANRQDGLYATDDLSVAHAVREWALEWGADQRMRIALCGYDGEHKMPDAWEAVSWKAHGGYGSQSEGRGRENSKREMIWFSPFCLKPPTLFSMESE